MSTETKGQEIEKVVQSRYGAVATRGLSSDNERVRSVAEAFGYSAEELGSIPAEANMGLSCGNPTAFASLREGETVVDLGSGGGLDVFLAAKKVGPTGKAIGIDMTTEMIELAEANRATSRATTVEFHLATSDKLPLPDPSVDCVISNCVINLAPDKPAVLREIARVLKPGGRLAVSDIALKKALPPEIGNDLMAYVGCIAGAIPVESYRAELAAAGFSQVEMIDTKSDLNTYARAEKKEAESGCCGTASQPAPEQETASGCCGGGTAAEAPKQAAQPAEETSCCGSSPEVVSIGESRARLLELMSKYDVNEYAASMRIYAVKP